MSDKSLILDAEGAAHLTGPRVSACLDATYQIESLAKLLTTLVPMTDATFSAYHAVLGIAGRIATLNSALMSGLGDESEPTNNLNRMVHPNNLEVENA